MFTLIAPWPSFQTTSIIPSPGWGNFSGGLGTFDKARSMNGTLYTYVKSRSSRKKHQWSFLLSRNKMLELQRFVDTYYLSVIKITDHDDQTYLGYIINNPVEFTAVSKAPNWPGGEAYQVTLDFEEKE